MKNQILVFLLFSAGLMCCSIDRRKEAVNFEGGESESSMMMMVPQAIKKEAQSAKTERMLIKNGTLNFSVTDIEESKKEIEKICKEFNGYIASEEQQRYDHRVEYEQVLRVPATRFEPFVKVIEGLGLKVDARNITSQDVTEEFIDVEARLKTKKELDARYHQLLAKAKNVTEMLAIEEQIGAVRSEIESMEGRLNFLKNQVGFSTLTINYYQTLVTDYGFGSKLVSAFVIGWTGLLEFFIGIISAWPFIIILGVGLWGLIRWSRRVNFRLASRKVENQ
jgi:hypothetical protein